MRKKKNLTRTESNFFLILFSSIVSDATSAICVEVRSIVLGSDINACSVVCPNVRGVVARNGDIGGLVGVYAASSTVPVIIIDSYSSCQMTSMIKIHPFERTLSRTYTVMTTLSSKNRNDSLQ